MSIERYFQRAHDEARRLLREMPWLASPRREPDGSPRWLIAMHLGRRDEGLNADRQAQDAASAVRAALEDHAASEPRVLYAARLLPFGLRRILDRAMFEPGAALIHDGSPTLSAGEGAEARRLLEMIDWDRVPQSRWPEVFDTLRMAVVWRAAGHENWLSAMRSLLEEDGYLAGGAKRCAA